MHMSAEDGKKHKTKHCHKVPTLGGKTHNFTARNVNINKLAASRKLNPKRLLNELQKEKSLLDASDIPIGIE